MASCLSQWSGWQGEGEARPVADAAVGPDSATLAAHDASDDGQADARAGKLGAVQALEDSEELPGVGHVEAHAVVAHVVNGFPGGGLGLHAHRGVRPVRAELHGVTDQVLPDLPDQLGIAGRIGQLAHGDRGPAALMAVAQVSHDRFDQRGHVDGHVPGVFPADAGQR
jgi:hypothetical protein